MKPYRIIYLHDNGSIRSYTDIDCDGDAQALDVMNSVICDLEMELWSGEQRLWREANRL